MQETKRLQPDIRAIARLIPASGNLVQGQNEIALNPLLARAVTGAVEAGHNHYSFFEGVGDLRRAIANKIRADNGIVVDPDARPLELVVTPGATGALVAIAHTHLRDASAIVFEPYYPYHKKTLATCDSSVDVVQLHGHDLVLDPHELRNACKAGKARSERELKAIIVCSPANPTGRVLSREELETIVACAREFDLMIISDEVYEHFTVAPSDHISTATLPGAFERTITVNSFSKSWAISGWRIGYAYGPAGLVNKLSQVGNIYYVCTATPLQYALSRVPLDDRAFYDRLRSDFARKREILAGALDAAGFQTYRSRSTFYLWTRIPERFADAAQLNEILIRDAGVAGVPGNAFADGPAWDSHMRLCVAREDATLEAAAGRITSALA